MCIKTIRKEGKNKRQKTYLRIEKIWIEQDEILTIISCKRIKKKNQNIRFDHFYNYKNFHSYLNFKKQFIYINK